MKIKSISYLTVVVALFLMFSGCNSMCNKKSNCMDSVCCIQNPAGFKISKGVNISHWLSQVYGFSKRDVFFTKEDVRLIDSLGFDHIRLPVDEKELWDDNGNKIPEAFNYLTSAIDWCMEYKVRVIVDLHIIRSFYFNANNEGQKNTLFSDPKEQQHFYNLWLTLSDVLKQYPDSMVAYELLNEAVADNHEDWNKLVAGGVKAIRSKEPNRVIFIGSNMWQITRTFKFLKVPANDKNLVLSFHNYDPLLITHYKANWTSFKDFNDSVKYPGQIISKEVYERNKHMAKNEAVLAFDDALTVYGPARYKELFKSAINKAKELKLELYCGEFGCLPNVKRQERLQYYKDITSVFNENNIAYTAWDYKGLFGIRKWDGDKNINISLDTELATILAKK